MSKSLIVAAIVCTTALSQALAHENKPHSKSQSARTSAAPAEQKDFGIAGDAKKVTRTVRVAMSDQMRFAPATLSFKQGETVRFVFRNDGKVMHEFVLGTKKELEEHAALMRKFPGMEHDEPYMAHVAPGKTGAIVWTFNRPGDFDFACLIPGHYEAGMVGTINVEAR